MAKIQKVYTEDRLKYWQTIAICFIPFLNIYIALKMIKINYFDWLGGKNNN